MPIWEPHLCRPQICHTPFGKLGKKTSLVAYQRHYWLLIMFIYSHPAMADTHSHLPTTPCDIRLVFGSDERGMPSVKYKLSLQIRNQTARDIAGVSVYWLDNSLPSLAIALQFAGQKMGLSARLRAGRVKQLFSKLAALCYKGWDRATWTEIINHQLTDFRKVKQCAIIGYDFRDSKPKTY